MDRNFICGGLVFFLCGVLIPTILVMGLGSFIILDMAPFNPANWGEAGRALFGAWFIFWLIVTVGVGTSLLSNQDK